MPFEVPFELGGEEILGGKGGGCWCDGFHPAGEALEGGDTQFLKIEKIIWSFPTMNTCIKGFFFI